MYYDENLLDLDQYLLYNTAKNRFSWNGTLEDLETFIVARLTRSTDDADGGNSDKLTKSYNSSCAILRLSDATFNFYRNTKTLQVQGKAAEDVKVILKEVVNNMQLAENVTEETVEHNNNYTIAINEESHDQDTSPENVTSTDDINVQESIISDSETAINNEIDKLWKAVNAIYRKCEFELPAKQSQTAALERELDEYKLRCVEYKEKIQNLQQERASLMEAIRILSTDQTVTTQHSQPPSDGWQCVESIHPDSHKSKSNQGKKKKKEKKASQTEQPQNEANGPRENHQETKRSNEETVIIEDSIIKGLRRDLLSKAAKRRVTVRSFPGATTADMKHYLQPCLKAEPKMVLLHVGTNDLSGSTSPRNVAEKIVDLGNMVASTSPDTRVTISAITPRLDEESLTKKVTDCNKILKTFCNQNGWGFVQHPNIDESCLNNRKLHLNRKGIAILASNLVNNTVH